MNRLEATTTIIMRVFIIYARAFTIRFSFFAFFICQSVNFYGNKRNRKEENERIKEENEGGIACRWFCFL